MTVRKIIGICIILIIAINSSIAEDDEEIVREFKAYVDIELGFYRVIDITTSKPTKYEGRNLTINQGDIVTWINDGENKSVTVMSKEDLWAAEDSLIGIDDMFSYAFESPGKYDIYIQEDPTIRQTILVNDTVGNNDLNDNESDSIDDDTVGDNESNNEDPNDIDGDTIGNDEYNDNGSSDGGSNYSESNDIGDDTTGNDKYNDNGPNNIVATTPSGITSDIIEGTMVNIANMNGSTNYSNVSNNKNNASINGSSVTKIDDKNRNLDISKFIWIIIIILSIFLIRTTSVLVTYKLGKILK